MRLFPKSSLLFCSIFSCLLGHAQLFQHHHANASAHKLIATNAKKTRHYGNGDALKIRYYNNGEIVKAKGRLLVDSIGFVEIIPYRNKPFVFISTDSIFSISRWHRKGKIALGVATGAGIVLGVVAVATSSYSYGGEGVIDNVLPLLLLVPVALDAYYILIATPIVFISEWASMRSQKKGYHFYVE